MGSILLGVFTLVLVLVCLLVVLVILMQRPSSNAGMGASLGGGAAESVFGGEAGNVLTGVTVKLVVAFFVLACGLYLGYLYTADDQVVNEPAKLSISDAVSPTLPSDTTKTQDATKPAEKVDDK